MLEPGRIVGSRYSLTKLMGTGGMATVWAATHIELSTPVAVKFQKIWVAGDRVAEEKFKKEARAAARLKSPHIVHVYDFGVDDGVPYIVMELLRGESLRDRLNQSPRLPPGEVLRWVRQAAKALDFAHKSGVVHRDVKPSNLFSAREGDDEVVKLLDFGIARSSDGEATGDRTESAAIVGSAPYMSREQARGEPTGAESDVWSLAIVAYEALFGETPFQGANVPDTLARINAGTFRLPSSFAPEYAALDAPFEAALHADPRRRTASAGAFAAELEKRLDASADAAVAPVVRGRVDDTATLETHVKPHRPARSTHGLTAVVVLAGAAAVAFAVAGARRGRPEPERTAEASATAAVPHAASHSPVEAASPPVPPPATAHAAPAPSAATAKAPRAVIAKARAATSPQAPPSASSEKKSPVSDPVFGLDITR